MSWDQIEIGSISAPKGRGLNPASFPAEDFELYSIPAHDSGKPEYVTGSEIGSSKQLVQAGDIMISKIVPHIQRVWVVPENSGRRQIASGEWIVYRSNKYEPRFLRHWLLSRKFHARFMGTVAGVGGSLLRARPAEVAKIEVPLPPIDEQRRIAAILDKADAVRKKRQQSLDILEDFLRATFLDMFGDPVTNPKGWHMKPLGSLCRIRRGGSPRPIKEFVGGDIPWIKIGDATKGDDLFISNTNERITSAGLSKTVYLEEGSLIFANCGVSLGFARILKIAGCIHDGWLAFDNIKPELEKYFILKALNSITNYFRAIAPDGTQPNLNTNIMKEFKLITPPIGMQKNFAAIVEKSNALKQSLIAEIEESNDLFASLSQRAFKGEL